MTIKEVIEVLRNAAEVAEEGLNAEVFVALSGVTDAPEVTSWQSGPDGVVLLNDDDVNVDEDEYIDDEDCDDESCW
jgi:hypothetical protein